MKIYLPVESVNDYSCYVVYDSQTIRAYNNTPVVGNNSFTDFYLNTHYLSKTGTQVISSTPELPVCMSSDLITNDYMYRLDLSHILVIVSFILMLIFFTFKVFARLFGRWLKL